eukprot:EG_transcript_22546
MAQDPPAEPVPSLAALQALPAVSAAVLQLAAGGAYLTLDEGAGSVGLTPTLTPACRLTLCVLPGKEGPRYAFLSASAGGALALDKGWLSTSVVAAKRDREPPQPGDLFALLPADSHPEDPPLRFLLAQDDQYVARDGDRGLGATAARAEAAAFRLLRVPGWPFAVEIRRSVIRFDRPAGKPDLVSAWDGGAIRHVFEVEEGLWQTETLEFRVHRRVTNLRQVVKTAKLGIVVSSNTTPMGSFEPAEELTSFTFPRSEVPEGFLVRGWYSQTICYESDEGLAFLPTHNEF